MSDIGWFMAFLSVVIICATLMLIFGPVSQ